MANKSRFLHLSPYVTITILLTQTYDPSEGLVDWSILQMPLTASTTQLAEKSFTLLGNQNSNKTNPILKKRITH